MRMNGNFRNGDIPTSESDVCSYAWQRVFVRLLRILDHRHYVRLSVEFLKTLKERFKDTIGLVIHIRTSSSQK